MKVFKPIQFLRDRKAASVPRIWLVPTEKGLKCYWPMYGLNKKLQNCVPPPLEIDTEERRKWQLLDCVLINRKEYYTYEEADAAISVLSTEFESGLQIDNESTRIATTSEFISRISTSADREEVLGTVETTEAEKHVNRKTSESILTTPVEFVNSPVETVLPSVVRKEVLCTLESTGAENYVRSNLSDCIEQELGAEGINFRIAADRIEGELGAENISFQVSPAENTTNTVEDELGAEGTNFPVLLAENANNTTVLTAADDALEHPTPDGQLAGVADQQMQVSIRFERIHLNIGEDFQYDLLQARLQDPLFHFNLLQTYLSIFGPQGDHETFIYLMLRMTFKDNILEKLSFRSYPGKLNVEPTPILNCWIEAVGKRFDMSHQEARQMIFDFLKRKRNNTSSNKSKLKKKARA